MSLLDDLLALVPFRDGVELTQRKAIDWIGGGWDLTDNPNTGRLELRTTPQGCVRVRAATVAAMAANTRTGNSFQANANGVLAAVDGVTLVVGDLFLDKNHLTLANRGVMVVVSVGSAGTPAQWSRATIADTDLEIRSGMGLVLAEEGTVNADRLFALTTNGTITLNTTGLAWSAVSGPPLAAGAGDDGKIFYASGGVPVLSSTIKIDATGAFLSFGASPATSGAIRLTNNDFINFRSSGGNTVSGIGMSAADRIGIGSSSASIVGQDYGIGSGNFTWAIAGTSVMFLDGTSFRLPLGGTAATSGTIRLANVGDIRVRNAANTANYLMIASNASDELVLGDDTIITNMILRVATSRSFDFRVNGAAVVNVTSTVMGCLGGLEIRFGSSNFSTGAKINVQNNVSIIEARNAANTQDLPVLSTSGDVVLVGGNSDTTGVQLRVATGGSALIYVNAVQEYSFTATAFDLLQNTLTGVSIIEIGTAPFPTLGVIRTPHATTLITGRNQANSGNINLFRFGSGANDRLTIGDSAAGATQIASTSIGLYNVTPVAQAADMVAITDSTGGTPSTTFAAITAGAGYTQADMTAVKNALASTATQVNKIRTALRNIGIMA